jgi:thiol-disulfide isomerase/thioredoxin
MKSLLSILALVSCLSLAPGLWSVNRAIASEPPAVGGAMQQFSFTDPPRPVPQKPFLAGDGSEVTLQDFKGHVLLVNFWATWCAPCVRELPSLDNLQRRLAGEGLLVLAVSQDRGGAKVAAPFLKKLGVDHVGLFLDPKMTLGRAFGVRALPWTILIDRNGRMVGQLAGYAEWDSDEAVALVRHYLGTKGNIEVEKTKCRCRLASPIRLTGN